MKTTREIIDDFLAGLYGTGHFYGLVPARWHMPVRLIRTDHRALQSPTWVGSILRSWIVAVRPRLRVATVCVGSTRPRPLLPLHPEAEKLPEWRPSAEEWEQWIVRDKAQLWPLDASVFGGTVFVPDPQVPIAELPAVPCPNIVRIFVDPATGEIRFDEEPAEDGDLPEAESVGEEEDE